MGIRYYAYPVAAELVQQARDDPQLFIHSDPLQDAWAPQAERPPMLYLDKCWSDLQRLTWPIFDSEPRPSYRLFEGTVSYVEDGYAWQAWTRVLDPDQIAEIAADIVLLADDDIQKMIIGRQGSERADEDVSYVRHYLTEAQKFVVDLARHGSAAVYLIG